MIKSLYTRYITSYVGYKRNFKQLNLAQFSLELLQIFTQERREGEKQVAGFLLLLEYSWNLKFIFKGKKIYHLQENIKIVA
jgi:hypothetical protein